MNIEIKNIKHSPTLSYDSNAFTANLYINGKKVCMVSDNGGGGGLDYRIVEPKLKPLLKEAEQWCKQLPAIPLTEATPEAEARELEMDLDLYISRLLNNYLQRQEDQKLERIMEHHLISGQPGSHYMTFKFKSSIQQILDGPNGQTIAANMLRKYILPEIEKGDILMNTNIPEDIILIAGLKEGQYVKPKAVTVVKPHNRKKPGLRP